ncbi:NAD-dependent epimerase/dehydratase family protein [Corynebacterium glutamicum]|uniref:NAD-dependent epimerase/dehydratase family protein n=1 Tax=Corynebacterium glutamicum TaxID=1718 RepID=UPI000744A7E4|nr:NAD-dependent epimerase/dehydratase family protein [Corynebacterium glutamicum]ALZ99134.1 hypothetical protein APT58_02185 [Corynebacterium glutamicum]
MRKKEARFQYQISPSKVSGDAQWDPRRWAVIGASGFIGSNIVNQLEAQGKTVVKISAPRLGLPIESRQIEAILAQSSGIINGTELLDLLRGCDVVINAAGMAAPDGSAGDDLYGANALLPVILMAACKAVGVRRFIHLSSAAVQGNRSVLDTSTEYHSFSPYSESKALGEMALLMAHREMDGELDLIIIRATSVQGSSRQTTKALRRVANSRLASVAWPGTQPTVVSSVDGLAAFVSQIGAERGELNQILLQPWERISTAEVLEAAGGKSPFVLPRWLCGFLVRSGYQAGKLVPQLNGAIRRAELMWFGQAQEQSDFDDFFKDSSMVVAILQGETNEA